MELKLYLGILTRRWRVALTVAIAIVILATVGSMLMPPKYQAVTMLRIVTPVGGSSADVNYQTTFATRLVNTYAQIAVSEQVMNKLRQGLGFQSLPDISVKIIPDSEILQIFVESRDPALAARTANMLANLLLTYQDDTAKKSSSQELAILEARKKELQAELAQYQDTHNELVQQYSQMSADMTVLSRTISLRETSYEALQTQYEQIVVSEAVFTNSTSKATKDALEKEIARLQEELDVLNGQYKELSTKSNEYMQKISLTSQMIQSTQNAYANLLYQYDNVSLANSRQENSQNIEIASPASDPLTPSSLNRLFVVGLGVIVGGIMGLLAAFLVDILDTRIFSEEQLGRLASAPVLGGISKFHGQPADAEKDAVVQRDYWVVRSKLKTLIEEGNVKAIMVTSPNRMEGKSTIANKLAKGLAQNSHRVLLVDVDLRLPTQHKLFGVTGEHGLSEFLDGSLDDIKDAIIKDVKPKLDLLPNLIEYENPTEMLQSPRMSALLKVVKAYDIVIFDTPAFLTVPDSLDLAKAVDGVLVIARWGTTTSSDIQSLCGYLESVGSKVLGMVVNQTPVKKEKGNYYSEYRQAKKVSTNPL